MIKNNKGFTLVELLSVIVLIGLLLGLGIPGINRIKQNMSKKSLNTKIKLIEQAAVLWGQDNRTRLYAKNNCNIDGTIYSCYAIKIEELINDNYLDSDKNSGEYIDPTDSSDMKNNCVYVYKKNNRVYAKYIGNSLSCTNGIINRKKISLVWKKEDNSEEELGELYVDKTGWYSKQEGESCKIEKIPDDIMNELNVYGYDYKGFYKYDSDFSDENIIISDDILPIGKNILETIKNSSELSKLYAYLKPKDYTVTFDSNGGTFTNNSDSTKKRSYNEKVGDLPEVTKTGYSLSGWLDNNNQQIDKDTRVTADMDFKADWKANTYTIKYDGNGDTDGNMNTTSVTYDTEVRLTKNNFLRKHTIKYYNDDRTLYRQESISSVFLGWAKTASGNYDYVDEASIKNLTDSDDVTVTLYAKWKDQTTTIISQTKNGYIFKGWTTTINGNVNYKPGQTITVNSDLNLYPVWEPNIYTIKYNNNIKSLNISVGEDKKITDSFLELSRTGSSESKRDKICIIKDSTNNATTAKISLIPILYSSGYSTAHAGNVTISYDMKYNGIQLITFSTTISRVGSSKDYKLGEHIRDFNFIDNKICFDAEIKAVAQNSSRGIYRFNLSNITIKILEIK